MLYVFKASSGSYVGNEQPKGSCRLAYYYVESLPDAKFFTSVHEAIGWLERVAFYNGAEKKSYNGSLTIIKIQEEPPLKPKYTEIGPVE